MASDPSSVQPKRSLPMILLLALLLAGAEVRPGELLLQEAASYRAQGRRYQEEGELQQAADAYRKAIAVHPAYADVYNDLGIILEGLGDLEVAEAAYRSALKLDSQLAAAHSNLALLYEQKGMAKEASLHWAARVRSGPPTDPWVVKAREKLVKYQLPVPESPEEIARKKAAEAKVTQEPLRQSEEKKRQQQKLAREQAEAARQQAEAARQEAEAARRQAEIARSQQEAARQAAREIERTKKRQTVEPAAKPAVEPAAPPAGARAIAEEIARHKAKARLQAVRELIQRGITAMRQGQYGQAASVFQQALSLDPKNPEAKAGLQRALAALSKAKIS